MSRCLACGAYVDGDVCDWRCEAQLYRERDAAEAHRLEENDLAACPNCGEDMPKDAALCGTCAAEQEPGETREAYER